MNHLSRSVVLVRAAIPAEKSKYMAHHFVRSYDYDYLLCSSCVMFDVALSSCQPGSASLVAIHLCSCQSLEYPVDRSSTDDQLTYRSFGPKDPVGRLYDKTGISTFCWLWQRSVRKTVVDVRATMMDTAGVNRLEICGLKVLMVWTTLISLQIPIGYTLHTKVER